MRILQLANVSNTDIQLVGGKAGNLGALMQAGFPVPQGFVITSEAYQTVFHSLNVSENLGDVNKLSPREQEDLATQIRQEFEKSDISQELESEIFSAHQQIQEKSDLPTVYAVRSSATAEDLANASFSGQHDTYYYVSKSKLISMVKKCWGSMWTAAAMSYRSSQGIEHTDVQMAVVVQEMIPSEVAGVTFTCNPLTGATNEIVTESSWGMGAAIVDGRVSPDRFIVDRDSKQLLERKISDKIFMVPSSLEDLGGSRLLEVPLELRQKESLSLEQVTTVSEWALKAEEYFGKPQDIEWALFNNNFYMLQSRPVTASGNTIINDSHKGQFVLFKAVAENFTGPLYPLTADLLINSLPVLEMINGRAYIDLAHLKPLFPFKFSDQEIANLAYLSSASSVNLQIDWLKVPKFLALLIFNHLISEVLYQRISNLPDDFMESFRKRVDDICADESIPTNKILSRLLAGSGFFAPAGNMAFLVNIISASRYPLFLGILTKLLRGWLPDLRLDAESMLCSGSEGVLSTNMGRHIWQLAKLAKEDHQVAQIILDNTPDKALQKLAECTEASAFISELDGFKRTHGHRALKEFELQSTRWDENPAPVIGMIRNYLLADSNPDAMADKIVQNRKSLEDEVRQKLNDLRFEKHLGWRWLLLNYLRNRTRYFIKQRENSRFYHIMSIYAVRKRILKMEQQLLESGALRCKDDIFYLDWFELDMLNKGEYNWSDVEDIIRERRMEQIRLTKFEAPRTVGIIEDKISEPMSQEENEIDILTGQGASPGVYVGIARVILDPALDTEIKPGEILIAPYTDPAWTPLFLIAHAAVIEVGSYLSHAGTIAREYGMPCVVDVENCTSKIKTGDRIRVNGTLGRIEFTQVEVNS